MKLLCRFVVFGFLGVYLLALVVLALGTFGLFGSDTDPLSGVYLIPLGFPWVLLVDLAPERFWPWLATLSPTLNLIILYGLCRRRKRRRAIGMMI